MRVGLTDSSDTDDIIHLLRAAIGYENIFSRAYEITTVGNSYKGNGLDILIINGGGRNAYIKNAISGLSPEDFVLLNADDKRIYSYLKNCASRFVTYGFSSKSCVTASSVMDSSFKTVQICIQRAFADIKGENIIQQEFPINVGDLRIDIHCLLASVAAALYIGISPETINSRFLVLKEKSVE